MRLYEHQQLALEQTVNKNKVAYYLDMGLGKTFVGSEKMKQLDCKINLVVCQKSKVEDWLEHFNQYYPDLLTQNLTTPKGFNLFNNGYGDVGIINYDLIFRRPELADLKDFTLMLDESSLIQNEQSKRSKFILRKLKPKNTILLSGTPTAGKYEKLWSQIHLLGWKISKELYWNTFVNTKIIDNMGFPLKIVTGYKNVDRLKSKLREYGAIFMKSEEVFNLPEQIESTVKIPTTKEYRKFKKNCIIAVPQHIEVKGSDRIYDETIELVGDTALTKMLYERQLCGSYNNDKLKAFQELIQSTEDRLIVFYNFNRELDAMRAVAHDRSISIINGNEKSLDAYENDENSITFVQYQAGAMGLNLQKANKIIYFTPPLSSEIYEQSKKRTHRIGQAKTCFYYKLICTNSIEGKIYDTLAMRKNYTEALFKNED